MWEGVRRQCEVGRRKEKGGEVKGGRGREGRGRKEGTDAPKERRRRGYIGVDE